jgi:hypothetical protein
MMKTLSQGALALLLTASLAFVTPLQAQDDSGRPLSATLSGSAEVDGGDEDGTGQASLRLNQGQEQICFELSVSAIDPATAAHIHRGAEGMNGPPVVTLDAPTAGTSSGCVSAAADLIMEIRQNPGDFYVNVHNDDFPDGAVRGQLSR